MKTIRGGIIKIVAQPEISLYKKPSCFYCKEGKTAYNKLIFTNLEDKMTDQFSTSGITSDDKLWALLSWLIAPVVPIIVLLMEDKKNRPFIKYHAIHGLIWSLVFYILGTILSFVVVGVCVFAVGFGFSIYWGIKSYQGEMVKVPLLTDFVKNQGWA